MPRSPEHHNRRPVALTPEVRPRRRRVYFAQVMKGKVDGQAASTWCLAATTILPYKLHAPGGVSNCAPCYVVVELEVGVDKAARYMTAIPKLLREFRGGVRGLPRA